MPGEMEAVVRHDIATCIHSSERARLLASVAAAVGKRARLHLKVDTGMGRLGVLAGQAPDMVSAIEEAAGVKLTGIYTHFATADEVDREPVFQQLELFRSIIPPEKVTPARMPRLATIMITK